MAMDPATAAAAGAGMSAVTSYFGARDANKSSERMSWEQMKFQESMSSTAYRRAAHDMKVAGLNPMLAAGGAQASSPSGAQAPVQNEMQGTADAVAAVTQNREQAKQTRMATNQIEEQTWNTAQDTRLKGNLAKKALTDEQNSAATNQILKEEVKAVRAETVARIHEAQRSSAKAKIDKKLVAPDAVIDRLGKSVGIGATGASAIRGGRNTINPKTTGTFNKRTGEID